MSRLARPHIPWLVREVVIDRQMAAARFTPTWASRQGKSAATRLRMKLEEFFGCVPVELHHRPALCNRQRYADKIGIHYDPPANSVEHLVYLPAADHDIETRVRGQHGQHSDLGLARKRKRKERKIALGNRLIRAAKEGRRIVKRKWPSRPFPKRKTK